MHVESVSRPWVSDLASSLLILRNFGVCFGKRIILHNVDLDIPARGVTVLMGPSAAGKSTLVRTLAGHNEAQPDLHTTGVAVYAGKPLGVKRPLLVMQKARCLLDSVYENLCADCPDRSHLSRAELRSRARQLLEDNGLSEVVPRLQEEVITLSLGIQRRLAILRAVQSEPRLLCLDEPTADLSDSEVTPLLDLIQREGQRRAVLFVTHNQQHAQAVGNWIALLCGGRIEEFASVAAFFSQPQSPTAKQFVRTGSCSLPAPDAQPEDLTEQWAQIPRPQAPIDARKVVGPRGFHWLKRGVLAGTPRPGLLDDTEDDLQALWRVGIRVLVTLEEEPFAPESLARLGFVAVHVPIQDMNVTTVTAALQLCERIRAFELAGLPVALHCRAGLGRTGTHLACQLIWEGKSAREALEEVRRIEPGWVQSEIQVDFLRQFAEALARRELQHNNRRDCEHEHRE